MTAADAQTTYERRLRELTAEADRNRAARVGFSVAALTQLRTPKEN